MEIDLDEIIWAMQDNSFDHSYFLDLKTGEVSLLSENYPEDDILENVENEPDRYVEIPTISSDEAYRDMKNFILTIEKEDLQKELLIAISHKKPFRRFKDILLKNPEEEIKWYDYKSKTNRQKAIEWLKSINIEVEIKNEDDDYVKEQIEHKQELSELSINGFVELASKISGIIAIALFGSLVSKKRIAKDIDLMVFIENTDSVPRLAKSYRKILGTYHQSLDVFVFTKNKKFLGNICFRKECPARSIDCGVPGCGKIKYIRRFPNLNLNENDILKLEHKILWVNPKHQSDFSFPIKS